MSLLLSYYGDDFTGSTDVMEALSQAGLRTVLFLQPPTAGQLAGFPGLRAFGIAGGSRTMSPEEMERELPPVLAALKARGAPIVHYKLCSTFDSSPQLGSIGRAIEIGRRVFGERPTPLVVGAPVLGRYVVFGNLFARSGLDTEPFRLDRHPTMSRHPVTPMKEADLRLILAEQTRLPVELVDVLKLEEARGSGFVVRGSDPAPIVLFDTLRNEHLPVIGQALEEMAKGGQLFAAGSSGVEYALTAHWNGKFSTAGGRTQRGEQDDLSVSSDSPSFNPPRPQPVNQILAVSGSCSPVTDRQIARAVGGGFAEFSLDPARLLEEGDNTVDFVAVLAATAAGRSVVLHTSRGPADARAQRRLTAEECARLGAALGRLLDRLLAETGLSRAVVCGGDTSMAAARAMGIESLEYLAPATPGCPLCRVTAPGRAADGRQMIFKGGQNGPDRFFLDALGTPPLPS